MLEWESCCRTDSNKKNQYNYTGILHLRQLYEDWVQTLAQAAKLWCLAHGFIYQMSALSTYDLKNMAVDKRISGASVIVQSAATDSKSSSNPPFMSTSIQTNTVVYRRISGAVVIVQSAATNSKSSSNPPFMPLLQATRNCLFQYNLVIGYF